MTQIAFDSLVEALRGRVTDDLDWSSVIRLANHTLLTPSLFAALVKFETIDKVPVDVAEYLRFLHDCNRDRNQRLRAQLFEAIVEFNAHDIAPLLLKGAVPLFLSDAADLPSRMTSDLDVAVDEAQFETAQTCLETLGYVQAEDFRGMSRPQDVGLFELRPKRAGGPRDLSELTERGSARALIPPPISRAEHWFMHDLIKEGDYVRGRLDLRHLVDLAELSEADGVDWSELRASLADQMSRNALDVQLVALHTLFGIEVPAASLERRTIRFHHWRRMFAARHRIFGAPLRIAGNLVWGARRLSRLPTLARRGPIQASRKIVAFIFALRPRSKL